MNGSVSSLFWIYFVLMVPLTAAIVGAWWTFDKRSQHGTKADSGAAEREALNELENSIMEDIRRRTGARVGTKTDEISPA